MSRRAVHVVSVDPGGVSERAGVRVGDRVLSVDDIPLDDSLDFELLASEPVLALSLLRERETVEVVLERDWGESLGLSVSHRPRACRLHCRFCFVDAQPKGMRASLCLKDDDLALSFTDGNFVTLSNTDDEDMERIEELGLSPLYISIHATKPAVRERLLRPRTEVGRDVLPRLRALVSAGVRVHAQIVLVPGYNDGAELEHTLGDLATLVPGVRSIAVVPVGLTRFTRDETLRTWQPDEAAGVLAQLEPWRARFLASEGRPTVTPSDEWYLLAGVDPPPAETYDGFPQIENGVGLVRQLLDALESPPRDDPESAPLPRADGLTIKLVTGTLARPIVARLAASLAEETGADVREWVVRSQFWGEQVTVVGLLTGQDLAAGLSELEVDLALVPDLVLNEDALFLDDRSADWLRSRVPSRVEFVSPELTGLRRALRKILSENP